MGAFMESSKNNRIVIKCVVSHTKLTAAQYEFEFPLMWPVLQVHEIYPTLPERAAEPYSFVFTSKHAVDMFLNKKALIESVFLPEECYKVAAVGEETAKYLRQVFPFSRSCPQKMIVSSQNPADPSSPDDQVFENLQMMVASPREERGLKSILYQEFIEPYQKDKSGESGEIPVHPPHAVYVFTSKGGVSQSIIQELGISSPTSAKACWFQALPLYELRPWPDSPQWIERMLRQKNMVASGSKARFHFVFCCRSGRVMAQVIRELCAYYSCAKPIELPLFFSFFPWEKSAFRVLAEEGLEERMEKDLDIDFSP
jgi:hypothetical protein